MADFQRQSFSFVGEGFSLASPVDRIQGGKHRLAFNCRNYSTGQYQGRQGLTAQSSGALGVGINAIKEMVDLTPLPGGSFVTQPFYQRGRFLGTDNGKIYAAFEPTLATEPTVFSEIGSGFSRDPISFVDARPEMTNRPWCFIYDSRKNTKNANNTLEYQIGVAPPNFAPEIVLFGGANSVPDGPDTDADHPYIYRFRCRLDTEVSSGAISNPGPPVRFVNGLVPDHQGIQVTVTFPGNPTQQPANAADGSGVGWLVVERFGGSLPVWLPVGTVRAVSGAHFVDVIGDAALSTVTPLPEDLFQPWLTQDYGKTGTCTVTANGPGLGAILVITGGDNFKAYDSTSFSPYYTLGNQIFVNGNAFTFYKSPHLETRVELVEDPPAGFTGGTFLMPAADCARTPLQCAWGPFGGGSTGTFVFACGRSSGGADDRAPGSVFWTKGNNPEANPGTANLQITSGSELMQNGCLYDGKSFVWSTDRMFQLYPSFGQTSDFTAIEVPSSKGLWAKWALAVGPHIWFLSRDGIYECDGSSFVSITDNDLYPIFPHEGSTATATQTPDGLTGTGFAAVDMSQEALLRLEYMDGFLYFDYPELSQGSPMRTLVYDTSARTWISRDNYADPVLCHYAEQGPQSAHKMLMGTAGGVLCEYGGTSDLGAAIDGRIRTAAKDFDDPRPRKFFGDIELDFDSECAAIDFKAGFDNYGYLSNLTTTGLNLNGRRRVIADINSGTGQIAFNIGLDLSWSSSVGIPVFYNWTATYVPKPELTALRVTDWTDCGYQGAKFMQGVILHPDSLGSTRSVKVQADGADTGIVLQVTATGEMEIPFGWTPFVAHLVRLLPKDSNFWREITPARWIFEPLPEAVLVYETQELSYGWEGFGHHRDAWIGIESTADVTWTVTVDNVAFVYTIPSTAGLFVKSYHVLQPMKGKATKHRLSSSQPFRLYSPDSVVRLKPWGQDVAYTAFRPFGEVAHLPGEEARI